MPRCRQLFSNLTCLGADNFFVFLFLNNQIEVVVSLNSLSKLESLWELFKNSIGIQSSLSDHSPRTADSKSGMEAWFPTVVPGVKVEVWPVNSEWY